MKNEKNKKRQRLRPPPDGLVLAAPGLLLVGPPVDLWLIYIYNCIYIYIYAYMYIYIYIHI